MEAPKKYCALELIGECTDADCVYAHRLEFSLYHLKEGVEDADDLVEGYRTLEGQLHCVAFLQGKCDDDQCLDAHVLILSMLERGLERVVQQKLAKREKRGEKQDSHCPFDIVGKCRKNLCGLRHQDAFTVTQLREGVENREDIAETYRVGCGGKKHCSYFLMGACRNGQDCGFAHVLTLDMLAVPLQKRVRGVLVKSEDKAGKGAGGSGSKAKDKPGKAAGGSNSKGEKQQKADGKRGGGNASGGVKVCRDKGGCKNPKCSFAHPVPCPWGKKCRNPDSCKFEHNVEAISSSAIVAVQHSASMGPRVEGSSARLRRQLCLPDQVGFLHVAQSFDKDGASCLASHAKRVQTLIEQRREVQSGMISASSLVQLKDLVLQDANLAGKIIDLEKMRLSYVDMARRELESARFLNTQNALSSELIVQIVSSHKRELVRLGMALPFYSFKDEVCRTVLANQVTIILGETGSGKSTQAPQYLMDALRGKHMICTQPRKVAALGISRHLQDDFFYGSRVVASVGGGAGRKQREASAEADLTFMTDRMLVNRSSFSGIDCVVLDEVHLRTIETDILLALCKKHASKNPEFRVVVTSATMNAELFSEYFGGAPILRIPGRAFPVEIVWGNQVSEWSYDYVDLAVKTVVKAFRNRKKGDILVFLTGASEIDRACAAAESALDVSAIVLPLHGKLDDDAQARVFDAAPLGKRKVIFSTDVAETSITIDGVEVVIDCGVSNQSVFDPERNMSVLAVRPITQSSAIQRAGRAGRTRPGVCYRLFSEENFLEFSVSQRPEILSGDLGMAIVRLMRLGVRDPTSFDFIEPPAKAALLHVMFLAECMGVAKGGTLTDIGLKVADLELAPGLGRAILKGQELGCFEEICVLASLTGKQIFFRKGLESNFEKSIQGFCCFDSDLETWLSVWKEFKARDKKQQKAWAIEHCINLKQMRQVDFSLERYKKALRIGDAVIAPASEPESLRRKILQSLLSGMFQNVAVYSVRAILSPCKFFFFFFS
jgi:HrpA-like RNA helicase